MNEISFKLFRQLVRQDWWLWNKFYMRRAGGDRAEAIYLCVKSTIHTFFGRREVPRHARRFLKDHEAMSTMANIAERLRRRCERSEAYKVQT